MDLRQGGLLQPRIFGRLPDSPGFTRDYGSISTLSHYLICGQTPVGFSGETNPNLIVCQCSAFDVSPDTPQSTITSMKKTGLLQSDSDRFSSEFVEHVSRVRPETSPIWDLPP